MTSLPKASQLDSNFEQKTRTPATSPLKIRATEAHDGATLAELVRATHVLEPATGYAYVMMADLFGDTCAVAELDGQAVGCVIGMRPPRNTEALFVWQIGVQPRAQGRGIAQAMLDAILERPACSDITEVRATVAPSNTPSEGMFRAFARRHGASMERIGGYAADCFPEAHEAERMFRIAGLRSRAGTGSAPQ